MPYPQLNFEKFDELYAKTPPKQFAAYITKLLEGPNAIKADFSLLKKELAGELTAAKGRETAVRAISQAKFFVKFKQGVSDTLKAKVLPLNKATQDTIEKQIKKCQGFMNFLGSALGYGEQLQTPNSTSSSMRQTFVTNYNETVGTWDTLAAAMRAAVASAKAKEKKAQDVLDEYLRNKDTMKQLGGEDYKKFKKAYEAAAKLM